MSRQICKADMDDSTHWLAKIARSTSEIEIENILVASEEMIRNGDSLKENSRATAKESLPRIACSIPVRHFEFLACAFKKPSTFEVPK